MWFTASVLLKKKANESATALWEESILLIQASTEDEARSKAQSAGRKMETSFSSISGEAVAWEYDSIIALYELAEDDIGDGVVVFARHLSDAEVRSLRKPT